MARRNYSVDILSHSSIDKLKSQLTEYQGELQTKTWLLCQKLAEKGLNVARAKVSSSPLGRYVTLRVGMRRDGIGSRAVLVATGAVMESDGFPPFNVLLAIEFGAGVHYNPTPNPNADEFGYGVGTFPGQVHALDPEGWYYWDDDAQEWKHSYGVKATMPMYYAWIEMVEAMVETAREVFA